MKYFSVPADFKKETIDEYVKLNNAYRDAKIVETYGNITIGDNLGSGRVVSSLPRADLLDLLEYIRYAEERDIGFNYTLNNPYMQNREFTDEGIKGILEHLSGLYEIGVRTLTISMPSLISLVKNSQYDFKVKVSTICHITNVNKARAFLRMGIERLVLDESIHRDFKTLRRIVDAAGDKCELIVNTMCHRNCIYRPFHYNQTGGDSVGKSNEVAVNFFEHNCMLQRYENMSELLKLGWIRPEDLKYYTGIGIHYFKLQGRQHVLNGNHIRAIECYFKESYDGNLMDLLDMFNFRYSFKVYLDNKKLDGFITPFVNQENFCRNDCSHCRYCEAFAPKCMDRKEAEATIKAAKKFYHEFDQFKGLIDRLNPPRAAEQGVQIGGGNVNTEFALD